MIALAAPSSLPSTQIPDLGLFLEREVSHDAEVFALQAAKVDELIDAKYNFVKERDRLEAVAATHPELRERCLALVKTMDEHIDTLQEQIDRDLQTLRYGLHKAPAPSRFMDNIAG